jgi:GT2 family glycosyltransferase
MNETVAAVVVTYNRKQLLTECLNALLTQTRPVDKIILIDNASTDGTTEYLKERGYLDHPLMDYVRMAGNTGGAGGFHEGMKRGHDLGYEWLWLMDDDTIPSEYALNFLVKAINQTEYNLGYVCSRVNWIDGSPHMMNIPAIKPKINRIPFNSFEHYNLFLIEACSFVSVLIKSSAIKQVGLPIKEMFIWADDIEYTQRLTMAGFLGAYCKDSVVVHATRTNYCADIYTDTEENIWKYRYGVRNSLYAAKVKKGFLYYLVLLAFNLTIKNMAVFHSHKNNPLLWVAANTIASLRSIAFRPKINYVTIKGRK